MSELLANTASARCPRHVCLVPSRRRSCGGAALSGLGGLSCLESIPQVQMSQGRRQLGLIGTVYLMTCTTPSTFDTDATVMIVGKIPGPCAPGTERAGRDAPESPGRFAIIRLGSEA